MLPSELIPAVAYQIAPFPFSFRQYHTQADMDLVRGMAFAFEVRPLPALPPPPIMHSALIENFFSGMNSIQLLSMYQLHC